MKPVGSPPRKRRKPSPNQAEPLASTFPALVSSLSQIESAFKPSSPLPAALLSKLVAIKPLTKAVEDGGAPGDTGAADGLPSGWREDLDRRGVLIWNRSTSIRCTLPGEKGQGETWSKVVAELRGLAFVLISLGAIQPLTQEAHLALLSLATKASAAFLATGSDTPSSDALLSLAASHAESLQLPLQHELGAPTGEETKALLAYYSARTRASVREGNLAIAKWLMGKMKALAPFGLREEDSLAQMAFEVGSKLTRGVNDVVERRKDDDPAVLEQPNGANAAVEWLLWATELVEGREEAVFKALQLSILKTLAQAYLVAAPPRSGWAKAETTLSELLTLDPNPSTWRRYLKLVIDRKGGDGELAEAFKRAAKDMPATEAEGGLLISVMHRLGEDRHALMLTILAAFAETVVARLSSPNSNSTAPSNPTPSALGRGLHIFASQIVMASSFLLGDQDREQLTGLLDTLAAGGAKIEASPAFIFTTYVWRKGDQKYSEKKVEEAAEWYLLGAHPALKMIGPTTWSKSLRKAALCYSEVRMFDRADEVMNLGPSSGVGNLAKSHFVRFYNFTLKKDELRATGALHALVECPDFTMDMLLWAARTAHESGLKPLLTSVLTLILQVISAGARNDGVDQLVLIRSLVRLTISNHESSGFDLSDFGNTLRQHFETALLIATSFSKHSDGPESLVKNVTWLAKTGYNICIQFNDEWSPEALVSMYTVVASLMELQYELAGRSDPDTLSKLWTFRFAALSGQVVTARYSTVTEAKVKGYHELLSPVRDLRDSLLDAVRKHPVFPRAEDIEAALIGLEVEVLIGVGDWEAVAGTVEGFSSMERPVPIKIVKMIADQVTASSACPPGTSYTILHRSLSLLLKRKDVSIGSAALWIRTVITHLVGKGRLKEAFEYTEMAVHYFKTQRATYPKDEASWLVTVAWDQGVGFFQANSPVDARAWCSRAIEVARLSNSEILAKLEAFFVDLSKRYAVEDDSAFGST